MPAKHPGRSARKTTGYSRTSDVSIQPYRKHSDARAEIQEKQKQIEELLEEVFTDELKKLIRIGYKFVKPAKLESKKEK